MICNENTKNNGKRLIAAVAVVAVMICAFALILPAGNVSAAGEYGSIEVPTGDDVGTIGTDFDWTTMGTDAYTAYVISTPVTIGAGVVVTLSEPIYIAEGGSLTFDGTGKKVIDTTIYVKDGASLSLSSSGLDVTENCAFEVEAGATISLSSPTFQVDTNVIGPSADEKTMVVLSQGTATFTGIKMALPSVPSSFTVDLDGVADVSSTSISILTNPVQVFGETTALNVGEGSELTMSGSDIEFGGVLTNNGAVDITGTFASTGTITNYGDMTIGAQAKVTGAITNNGSVIISANEEGQDVTGVSIMGGEVTDQRAQPTDPDAEPLTYWYMDEGTVMNVDGRDYTIYHFPFGGKLYQYGVYLEPIDYKTNISIESLAMTWLPFNYSVTEGDVTTNYVMAFNPSMSTSWYDDGTYNGALRNPVIGSNPGVIMFSGSVYLDNTSQPTVFNKILDLVIEPVPTTLEVTLDKGWDIKQAYGEPEFTYTYTDIETGEQKVITSAENLPEGCTITYYLVDADGTRYEYPNWNAAGGLTFEEASQNFTLVGEVTAWGVIDGTEGVYAATSDEYSPVTLTNTTDLVSELVFGAPAEDATYYGVSANRLQKDLTLNPTEITFAQGSYEYTVAMSATVFSLSSYAGFWGEAPDAAGYYIAFTLTPGINGIEDFTDGIVTITNAAGEKKTFANNFDGFFVLYLGKTIEESDYTFTITYDADGAGTFYKDTSYTVTIDPTAGQWTYVIHLIDEAADGTEYNDEIYLDNDGFEYTEGDRIRLPNANGPEDQFLGWQAANGKLFNHDVYFLIQDKYADANGEIYLYAQYGESTGDDGEGDGDVTYADNVLVSLKSNETGVYVILTGMGGAVPEGSITVYYSYIYYNENFGMNMSTTGETLAEVVTNADGSVSIVLNEELPTDVTIVGVWAGYVIDEQAPIYSDIISYGA